MTEQADTREGQMVVVERDDSGKPTVWCDPEVAPLVAALNGAGFRTVASCSGHGKRPASIVLSDGREIIIAKDFDEARKIDGLFPGINGEPATIAAPAPVERVEQDAKVFWVLFDNTGDVKYIKKDVYSGTLAFFDNEADAALAKQITPDTDYKRVEYYTAPQPEPTAAQDVAGLVDALELALEYWRDRQQRYKNRKPRWVVDAESALAAHQGGGAK